MQTTDLMKMPGFGKKMAQRLIDISYPNIEALKGQNPEEIYQRDCIARGEHVCRCVLYCYRLAVAYADNNGQLPPGKINWYDYKD